METRTRAQLYEIAKKHEIPNRSKFTKRQLIAALQSIPDTYEFIFKLRIVYDNKEGLRVQANATSDKVDALLKWYSAVAQQKTESLGAKFEKIELINVNSDNEPTICVKLSNTRMFSEYELYELKSSIIEPDNVKPLQIRGNIYKVVQQPISEVIS